MSTYTTDQTAIRQVDVNLRQLLQSGRGQNLIQGSVALTDDDHKNCAVVLPGIHQRQSLAIESVKAQTKSWNKRRELEAFNTETVQGLS
ncbi:hypothetical protein N7540_008235 [Penicillium herquei]|nr:hypothetical protein N7540_008235 [Penicillium herquei]